MPTFKEFYKDVSQLFCLRRFVSTGEKIHELSPHPRHPRLPPDTTLPLTLSHFRLLRWWAVFRFLPADDVFVHCPLPVVGLGHGPWGLLTAAVRHDVDFGCIQRPATFWTVSRGASWMVWATGETDRQKLWYDQISAVGTLPTLEPPCLTPGLCEQNWPEVAVSLLSLSFHRLRMFMCKAIRLWPEGWSKHN